MINALLRISVSREKQQEVIRLLRSLIEPTSVEHGCIGCRLYRDVNDRDVLTWMEEWDTREDLERHLQSPRYRKILAVLDMSDAQPDVRFETVVETTGMRLIEEARNAKP